MTAIPASQRGKMFAVRLCGPRVIARLESIGITELRDLAESAPYQLIHEVNTARRNANLTSPNRGEPHLELVVERACGWGG